MAWINLPLFLNRFFFQFVEKSCRINLKDLKAWVGYFCWLAPPTCGMQVYKKTCYPYYYYYYYYGLILPLYPVLCCFKRYATHTFNRVSFNQCYSTSFLYELKKIHLKQKKVNCKLFNKLKIFPLFPWNGTFPTLEDKSFEKFYLQILKIWSFVFKLSKCLQAIFQEIIDPRKNEGGFSQPPFKSVQTISKSIKNTYENVMNHENRCLIFFSIPSTLFLRSSKDFQIILSIFFLVRILWNACKQCWLHLKHFHSQVKLCSSVALFFWSFVLL